MKKQYTITGMTCSGCVAKVKRKLEAIDGVESAQIGLEAPQGIITFNKEVPTHVLRQNVATAGKYDLSDFNPQPIEEDLPKKRISLGTYKPLLMIVGFVAGISLIQQYPFHHFSAMLWMRNFMAGFFIVFAFFKLLNLEGFAASYRMYDIVAAKWFGWGYVYPFVELLLGILYLLNIAPYFTNLTTVLVLGISSVGVIKSNMDKKQIKCACLGDVFNLPMSTVTIVEDLSMVIMAGWMLKVM